MGELFGLDEVIVKAIAVWKAHLVLALIITGVLAKGLSLADKLALLWFVYDLLIHVILEGSFLWMSLTGTVATNKTHPLGFVWREYGNADSRWAHSDPTIVSLEILTVVLCSLLCLFLIIAIIKRQEGWRHFLQIILSVMELYGGWMTFCPEWLIGSPSLNTSNPVYLWIYLWLANGIWVVIPGILLWQSAVAMLRAFPKKPKAASATPKKAATPKKTASTPQTQKKKNK
jgi:hypothetical protein